MDTKSQEIFDTIVAQDPSGLTITDRAFLRARREALTAAQAKKFEEVLKEKEVVAEPAKAVEKKEEDKK